MKYSLSSFTISSMTKFVVLNIKQLSNIKANDSIPYFTGFNSIVEA